MLFSTKYIYLPPRKRSFFPKIYLSLIKKLNRAEWYLRTNFNYYYRLFFKKNPIRQNKICILIPSKNRPEKLGRFFNSVISKTEIKNRVKILICLDEDEKKKDEYEKIRHKFISEGLFIEYQYKNWSSHSERATLLANKYNDEDLYFFIGDDFIFVLKNWDTYLDFIESKTDRNQPFSIWTRSNIYHEKYPYLHSDCPIINKFWFKKLGYIGSKYFNNGLKKTPNGFEDTWTCELGRLTKKFIITKLFILDHINAFFPGNSMEWDETADIRKSEKSDDFFSPWTQTRDIRREDAKKLLIDL